MNRTAFSILLLISLLSPLCAQHLFTERSAPRGEILNAFVFPAAGITESRFSLVDAKGRIVSNSDGFILNTEGQDIVTALLGIPSDLEPGRYTLKVFCTTEQGSQQFSKPFFVTDRKYQHMDIKLDKNLTDLRTDDDPLKVEQSRQLWAVLSSFEGGARYFEGELTIPLSKYIETASFGDRRRYVYNDGSTADSLHYGIDMAAPLGTPVHAAADGKVVMVEKRILTGNTVVIEHLPGVYSLYYHMDSVSVDEGMVVKQGTEIGKVGQTGLATGPHLHWELRVSGIPVDPLKYMGSPLIDKEEILNIISSIH